MKILLISAFLCAGVLFCGRPLEAQSAAGEKPKSGLAEVLSKYEVEIGGRVKVDFNYDTVEFARYNDFIGVVKAGDASHHSSNINPRDSRIDVKVTRDEEIWLNEARVETDFYGDNNGNNLIPRLRLGYVKASNKHTGTSFLAGQDWMPIATLNPPTIDFGVMATAGNLWTRLPQLTVRQKFADDWEFLVSAARYRRLDTSEEVRMPYLLSRLAYSSGPALVALGAGYRNDKVVGASEESHAVDRWVSALELSYKVGSTTFMVEPWMGKGVDGEFTRPDLGVNTARERPQTIFAWGGFAAITQGLTDRLNMSFGYGIDNPRNRDLEGLELNDRRFESNQYSFINSWYSLTEVIRVGAETIYLRTDRGDETNDGFRFTLSTMMLF